MKNFLCFVIVFICCSSTLIAQQKIKVSGTVTDKNGIALPGASIILKGTNIGVEADFDGNYVLTKAPSNGVLVASYIGYKSLELFIDNRSVIDIKLEEDAQSLSEVVVVGYGTQKKADLTGSIVTVKAEEIEKSPTANIMQSLQGKVSGLQVVSTGSPGSSPTIRVRGLGTYTQGTNVLYVVDGMLYSNIDFLNTKDIKSVNVLKDASSSAIYGVRGANGVIIIETKKGDLNKKMQIEYDGYTGIQRAQNILKMANAEQFVNMAIESGSSPDVQYVLNAMQRYGRSRINPNVPDVNTSWYDEVLRDGIIQNHSINVLGGNENASYSIGTNYFSQEGLLNMKNQYERFNIRSKIETKISDKVRIGVNSVFSNATKYSPENGAWFNAYFAVPIMPVFDDLNTEAFPNKYSNAQLLGYRGTQNPFTSITYNNNRLKIRKLLSSIYFKWNIHDKLSFTTTYNHDYSSLEERYVKLPYTLGNNVSAISSITRKQNNYSNQTWDNILNYKNTFNNHELTLMAGTSFRDEARSFLSATGKNITGIQLESSWFLDFAEDESFSGNVRDNAKRYYGISYFGRASYNYKNKYLLYGTLRADGSSKFTKNPWGYFPSIGLGWVLSEEDFMQNNQFLDYLKLRASWGQLGNDNVAASTGSNTVRVITTPINDIPTTGVVSTSTYTDNTWELIEEKNFGINARFLKNKLSLEADYYIRDTKDAILPVYIPIIGLSVRQNAGIIRNQGLELNLDWKEQVSDNFKYNIGLNITTLKNKALELPEGANYINSGNADFRQRTELNGPLFGFYGLEVAGVYQNQAEVTNDQTAIENNLEPGDFKYKDQNGDGIVNEEDRVVLGSFLPKLTYGGNLGASYKGFDFSLNFYGQRGNKILNRKRGEIRYTNDTNMDADLAINRWHGEGTSNSYPSSKALRKGWNQQLSNFYVEDGDFFRIQNIQIAYTINNTKMFGKSMPKTRVYFTAERPLTLFRYNGFNPEVSNGIDRQTYPVPAIYTFGINIKL